MAKKALISFEYDSPEELNHILTNIAEEMPNKLAPFNFPLFKMRKDAEPAGQVEVFAINEVCGVYTEETTKASA